jgi:hypothetical protein
MRQLYKTADQICPRCLAIFLNGSRSVFALRRIAKLVRFRALAMVSTLFALRTSARSSLSRSAVQGRRGVPVICPSPPSRRDRSVIVRRQANAVPRLKRAMRLPSLIPTKGGLAQRSFCHLHAARGILHGGRTESLRFRDRLNRGVVFQSFPVNDSNDRR